MTMQPQRQPAAHANESPPPEASAGQSFLVRYLEVHAEQTGAARVDLERLRALTGDAGARLLASFESIQELLRRHQDLALRAGGGRAEGHLLREEFEAVGEEADAAVAGAVSALQFQDMADQLLAHALGRIVLLENIARPLARLHEASEDDLLDAMESAGRAGLASPVGQSCMSGGSVDLF